MKRKGNLYQNIYKIENIISAYDEVCRNTKNKNKVDKYKEYRCIYIARIYAILENKSYVSGPYNRFTIYEPKERKITSQGMQDKTINHLVARHILYPAILPCLLDVNVAVIVHIVQVVSVARIRRGQPDNYALIFNFLNLF